MKDMDPLPWPRALATPHPTPQGGRGAWQGGGGDIFRGQWEGGTPHHMHGGRGDITILGEVGWAASQISLMRCSYRAHGLPIYIYIYIALNLSMPVRITLLR